MADINVAFLNPTPNIPARELNGGLYTGEPFQRDAPWANVPVIPDAAYMTHFNLKSANPPTEALYQYPGSTRPGNNTLVMYGVEKSKGPYNLDLIGNANEIGNKPSCQCYKCDMAGKYSYIK